MIIFMGRIVRRNEINRRRARREKLTILKKRYIIANNEKTKAKVIEDLSRVAPWLVRENFLEKK